MSATTYIVSITVLVLFVVGLVKVAFEPMPTLRGCWRIIRIERGNYDYNGYRIYRDADGDTYYKDAGGRKLWPVWPQDTYHARVCIRDIGLDGAEYCTRTGGPVRRLPRALRGVSATGLRYGQD